MTDPERSWSPPWQAQATEWWLKQIMRFGIGGGGLVYEVLIDKLRNPTALVIFGGLAGLPDVIGYRAEVKKQVKAEQEKDGRP